MTAHPTTSCPSTAGAGRRRRRGRGGAVGLLAAGALLLTGCGLQPASSFVPTVAPGSVTAIADLPADASLTVTGKAFTEQQLLGKMLVLTAQAAGFEVTDLSNVPGSQPVRELMLSGRADLTYEYTGTAWLTFLGQEEGIADPTEQWQAVREADAGNGLSWLAPGPLNNTYAMAVRSEAVEELGGISTLSDVAELPVAERTFCVEPEFNSRSDGLGPMLEAYDIPRGTPDGVPEDQIALYDVGAVYTATDQGACNFGEVYNTDGRVESLDLTLLEDDREFFASYNVAPVVRTETLQEHPGLAERLELVTAALTDERLRELNLRVDEGGEEPADVAYDFMLEQGFITAP